MEEHWWGDCKQSRLEAEERMRRKFLTILQIKILLK